MHKKDGTSITEEDQHKIADVMVPTLLSIKRVMHESLKALEKEGYCTNCAAMYLRGSLVVDMCTGYDENGDFGFQVELFNALQQSLPSMIGAALDANEEHKSTTSKGDKSLH